MKRLELVISMNALLENARAVRGRVPENVKICAVVKADAYGHGAAELSRALESERLADAFAVATPEEGRALREAGVKGEILVLGLTDADGAEESVALALAQAVDDASSLAMLERAAAWGLRWCGAVTSWAIWREPSTTWPSAWKTPWRCNAG